MVKQIESYPAQHKTRNLNYGQMVEFSQNLKVLNLVGFYLSIFWKTIRELDKPLFFS